MACVPVSALLVAALIFLWVLWEPAPSCSPELVFPGQASSLPGRCCALPQCCGASDSRVLTSPWEKGRGWSRDPLPPASKLSFVLRDRGSSLWDTPLPAPVAGGEGGVAGSTE